MKKEFLRFKDGVGTPLLEHRINFIINEIFDCDGNLVAAINNFEDYCYKGDLKKTLMYLAAMKNVVEELDKAIIKLEPYLNEYGRKLERGR